MLLSDHIDTVDQNGVRADARAISMVSAGNLCDELKRQLLRTPRLNLLGNNSSVALRGALNAVELHVDVDIVLHQKTPRCLRVALVLRSLARNAGKGKCGAALLSPVSPVSLVHRTDRSVLSETPTSTSMLQSLSHDSGFADSRLRVEVLLGAKFHHPCAKTSRIDLTMNHLLRGHLTLIRFQAPRIRRQLDMGNRNTRSIGAHGLKV